MERNTNPFPPTDSVRPEEIMSPPEELYDSCNNKRALVHAAKQHYVEIDGCGYYPANEYYYDVDGNIRGFSCPEGIYVQGRCSLHAICWNIKRSEYFGDGPLKGPYLALLKFAADTPLDYIHVLDGKYDRVIELPTPEGMLFFDEEIADAIIEPKEIAERILKEGLLSVRHYCDGYLQENSVND